MAIAECKKSLIDLLEDDENYVIALSGNWGTGKSYLWTEVQKESGDEKIKESAYVSLFGLSSITELRQKIARDVLLKHNADNEWVKAAEKIYAGGKKILEGFLPGSSALDELASIAVQVIGRGRFIVIDDIERKHEKLSIDEILGFIDDCVQNSGCRILLILNSDKLKDKKLWEIFHEKVIDQGLRLDTSPTEAFDIAQGLTPTIYAEQIKLAVDICQITNIRIIRKIIRVVNRLLANREQLPPNVLKRFIPSATFLSAIYYRGLENGFDFDCVRNFMKLFVVAPVGSKISQEGMLDDGAQERLQRLMSKLDIHDTGEVEILVADYLRSGSINADAGRTIDRYLANGRKLNAHTCANGFRERCTWHVELSDAELLDELKKILPDVGMLSVYWVTALHDCAMGLAEGSDLAKRLIDDWLAAFLQRSPSDQEDEIRGSDIETLPAHPRIRDEFLRSERVQQLPPITLLKICQNAREGFALGPREEAFLKEAKSYDFEVEILSAKGDDLKILLPECIGFLKKRDSNPYFRITAQCFLSACRIIVQRDPDSRRSKLIHNLFRVERMEFELATPATAVTSDAAVN